MYEERKVVGGTVCGLLIDALAAEKAEEKPEKVQAEKVTEEKPKTAKTAQKRKNTGK